MERWSSARCWLERDVSAEALELVEEALDLAGGAAALDRRSE